MVEVFKTTTWKTQLGWLFFFTLATAACTARAQAVGASTTAAVNSRTATQVSAAAPAAVSASISAAETIGGKGSESRKTEGDLFEAEETYADLVSTSDVSAENGITSVKIAAGKTALKGLEASGRGSHQISGHAREKSGGISGIARNALSGEAIHSRIAEKAVEMSRAQSNGEQNNRSPQAGVNDARYLDDFQDSTKDTALISPPDPGTESPLTWDPGFSAELADFSGQEFLKPSIHVGGNQQSKGKAQGQQQGKKLHKNKGGSQKSPASRNPFAMPSPLQTQTGLGLPGQSGLGNSGLNPSGLNSPDHDYFSNLH